MFRTSLILVASFGLLAGCASSSSTSSSNPQNPDAGKVDYDVGSGGGSGSGSGNSGASGGGNDSGIKGRDTTSTRAVGVAPKAVKKIAAAKPPKPEPPAEEPAKKPSRVPRVVPNGLLAEAFTIDAAATKLPDFSGTPKALFIAPQVDGSEAAALAGVPRTVSAPIALRFSGSLNITEAAEYNLCVTSDDGSQLLIEDTLIVDNDGVMDKATELCELVSLEPGEYKLELRSFHTAAPLTVRLTWAKGKDGAAEVIPNRSLFKPEGADARVKAGK